MLRRVIHFPVDDVPVVPLHDPGPLAHRLFGELSQTLKPAPADPEPLRAVAAGVAQFLRDEGIERAPLPLAYLHCLAYRALRAAAMPREAAAWRRGRLADSPAAYVGDPRLWRAPVPLEVWRLLETRVARPWRSLAWPAGPAWMLDFRRFRPGDAPWLELSFFPVLERTLRWLAPAWDPKRGAGTLALRGFDVLPFARPPRPAAVLHFCSDLLSRLAPARSWSYPPTVLSLDLPPHRARPAAPAATRSFCLFRSLQRLSENGSENMKFP